MFGSIFGHSTLLGFTCCSEQHLVYLSQWPNHYWTITPAQSQIALVASRLAKQGSVAVLMQWHTARQWQPARPKGSSWTKRQTGFEDKARRRTTKKRGIMKGDMLSDEFATSRRFGKAATMSLRSKNPYSFQWSGDLEKTLTLSHIFTNQSWPFISNAT